VPMYEYQCEKCNRRTEKIEKVDGPHLKKCPHCGGKVEQLMSAPAIQFKGSGWYVTDYAGKKGVSSESISDKDSGSEKSDGKNSDNKESSNKESSKESKEAKESKASKESKDSKEKKSSKKKD
jgi:putative FmdB family regulatory protein